MDLVYTHLIDARVINGFGGQHGAAFISGVRCSGSENDLTSCDRKRGQYFECDGAGVACGKSTCESTTVTKSNSYILLCSTDVGRCMDEAGTPTSTQTNVRDER